MGFVVVKPKQVSNRDIFMRISERYTYLSEGALNALGYPEYVNIFLDEKRNMVMIKAAAKNMENVFLLGLSTRAGRRMQISCTSLNEVFGQMIGKHCRVYGHAPKGCEGMVIFDRK